MQKLAFTIFLSCIYLSCTLNANQTFIYARRTDVITLDPSHTTDFVSQDVSAQIYDTLVKFKDGTTEIEPSLATSWEISEDGLEYIFHLKKNVYFAPTKYFTKTSEFTADDVVFSFRRQYDKTHPFHLLGSYEAMLQILQNSKNKYVPFAYWSSMGMDNFVKSVKKVDKYTVKFELKEPSAPFMTFMAMEFASILSKDYAFSLARKGKAEQLGKLPIGTGAFVFDSWQKDKSLVLVKNENFHRQPAKLDKVIIQIIPDSKERLLALKKGQIHLTDSLTPGEINEAYNSPNISVLSSEGLNVRYVAMNQLVPFFKDKKVRQAINYAIDTKAFNEAVYGKYAEVINTPIPPTMWSYNPNVKTYDYDPEKAKELLRQSSYPNGFKTSITIRSYMSRGVKLLQQNLAQVGIQAEIISLDKSDFYKYVKAGKHHITILGWNADNGDPDNFLYTLLSKESTQIPANNRAFWINEEYNSLVTRARLTTNIQERIELYQKAQEVFAEDAPWAAMSTELTIIATSKNVKGIKIQPTEKHKFELMYLE